jgi:uncharacterized membrane protein SirB2
MNRPLMYYEVLALQKMLSCAGTFSFLKILYIFTFLSLGVIGMLDSEWWLNESKNKKKKAICLIYKFDGIIFFGMGFFCFLEGINFMFICQNIFKTSSNWFYNLILPLIIIYFLMSILLEKDKKIKIKKFIIFIVELLLIGLVYAYG